MFQLLDSDCFILVPATVRCYPKTPCAPASAEGAAPASLGTAAIDNRFTGLCFDHRDGRGAHGPSHSDVTGLERPLEDLVGPRVAVSCDVEDKRYVTPFPAHDLFRDFPYKGAHRFRNRLAAKIEAFEVDGGVQPEALFEALLLLGPAETDDIEKFTSLVDVSPEDVEVDDVPDSNPFSVLDDGCQKTRRLRGKAETLLRFYAAQGLKPCRELPSRIMCGGLRAAVRSCYPDSVGTIWELSLKTVQKCEDSCCSECEPEFAERLARWESSRTETLPPVDAEHVERFKRVVRYHVQGWDGYRRPFIPNGHATRENTRRKGGNWNEEEFSDGCRVEQVFASGKPRVVTLYSAFNTATLAPLHYSLYHHLSRFGWILKGPPTEARIGALRGGDWVSIDYEASTDNIRVEYVDAAIDVLVECASLSPDEERCLRCLSRWRIGDSWVTRGQPMGSIFSFPLLCLLNKVSIDLGLLDLLDAGDIKYKKLVDHRCLVNGDDALYRDVGLPGRSLRVRHGEHSSRIGFKINWSKAMISPAEAEINSTLFVSGTKVKKFNAASIWMSPDVTDVLGLAFESTSDAQTFKKVVLANRHILARQPEKGLSALPAALQTVCRKVPKIRAALVSAPDRLRPVDEGVLRMAELDLPMILTRNEKDEAITREVARVRARALVRCGEVRNRFRAGVVPNHHSYRSLLRRVPPSDDLLDLQCVVRANKEKHQGLYVSLANESPNEWIGSPDSRSVHDLIKYIRTMKAASQVFDDPVNGSDDDELEC